MEISKLYKAILW